MDLTKQLLPGAAEAIIRMAAIQGIIENTMDYLEPIIEQWDSENVSDIVKEEASEEIINTFIIRMLEMRTIIKDGLK